MSLRLTTDYRLLQHLSAFAAAWLAASSLFVYVLRPITVPQPTPGYHIRTLGKGEPAVRNLLYMSDALRYGRAIVVLGSSELDFANSNDYSPDIFFPQHHLAKVITYGRAGFETLGMYGLLYSLKPHLNSGSRLVIVLSPEWFRTTNLASPTFNNNFNDDVLLQIYWSDDPRGVFHDYLISHQFDFNDMTSTQSLFMDDPASIIDWQLPEFIALSLNARAYAQREKVKLFLARLGTHVKKEHYDAGNAKDLPWDKYERDARDYESRHMTGNDLWVRSGFYKNYLSTGGYRRRTYFPDHMNPEPEMDGFRLLLQLLQRSKVKALFIMQPVNPKLFDDLAVFNPVDARIAALCREYGMAYMDLYAMPYQKGVLKDGVHPGELGWEMIDQRISEYFSL